MKNVSLHRPSAKGSFSCAAINTFSASAGLVWCSRNSHYSLSFTSECLRWRLPSLLSVLLSRKFLARCAIFLIAVLLPLPTTQEWGEDRGAVSNNAPPLPDPLLHR